MRALQHLAGAAGSSSLALVRRAVKALRSGRYPEAPFGAGSFPAQRRLGRLVSIHTAAAMVILFLAAGTAQAHDEASWIMDNGDPNVRRCCGKDDCSRISKDAVRVEAGGVRILATDELIPYDFPGLFASIDQDWWRCTVDYWAPGASAAEPRTRCLFYPGNS